MATVKIFILKFILQGENDKEYLYYFLITILNNYKIVIIVTLYVDSCCYQKLPYSHKNNYPCLIYCKI